MQKKVANAGVSIADPLATGAARMIIQHGRFWKRGARTEAQPMAGGQIVNAHMDWMEPVQAARGGIIRTNSLVGGLMNAGLDSLTSTPTPFVGYAGVPSSNTLTGLTSSSMAGATSIPKVTYSYSAQSKSYSPATMLAK